MSFWNTWIFKSQRIHMNVFMNAFKSPCMYLCILYVHLHVSCVCIYWTAS